MRGRAGSDQQQSCDQSAAERKATPLAAGSFAPTDCPAIPLSSTFAPRAVRSRSTTVHPKPHGDCPSVDSRRCPYSARGTPTINFMDWVFARPPSDWLRTQASRFQTIAKLTYSCCTFRQKTVITADRKDRLAPAAYTKCSGRPVNETDSRYNFQARFCCRFAADATTGNCL